MFDYFKLRKKYNALQTKYESLKDMVKDDCFKEVIKTINQNADYERYKKENIALRKKLKILKQELEKNNGK